MWTQCNQRTIIITATISSILAVLITGGNLLVVIAVWNHPFKNLRTPFMYVLVNLAVSDILVGIVSLPITTVRLILDALGQQCDILPHISRITFFISATASIPNLVVLFIDRYFVIRQPIKYRQYSKFKKLVLCFLYQLAGRPLICLKVSVMYRMLFANTSVAIDDYEKDGGPGMV